MITIALALKAEFPGYKDEMYIKWAQVCILQFPQFVTRYYRQEEPPNG